MANTYSLDFYDSSGRNPPVLLFGVLGFGGRHINQGGPNGDYIVGNLDDPHWKIYPKAEWLTARNKYPISYAFTNYIWDTNHFFVYMPDNSGHTNVYSRMLRDHFETIHNQRQAQASADAAVATKQAKKEEKERIRSKKAFLQDQKNELKRLRTDVITLNDKKNRDIRSKKKELGKQAAETQWNDTYPGQWLAQTLSSIEILKKNIKIIERDLKS